MRETRRRLLDRGRERGRRRRRTTRKRVDVSSSDNRVECFFKRGPVGRDRRSMKKDGVRREGRMVVVSGKGEAQTESRMKRRSLAFRKSSRRR